MTSLAEQYANGEQGSDNARWQSAEAAYGMLLLPDYQRKEQMLLALQLTRQDASMFYKRSDAYYVYKELLGCGLVDASLRDVVPFTAWHTVAPLVRLERHELAAEMLQNFVLDSKYTLVNLRTAISEMGDGTAFSERVARVAKMLERLYQDSEGAGIGDKARQRLRRVARIAKGII